MLRRGVVVRVMLKNFLLHNVYTRSLIPCIQHGTIIMMMIIITIIITIIIIIIIIIIFNKGAQLTTAVLSGALIN